MENKTFAQHIGERVRRRRMVLGLLQKELATRAKVPQEHLSHLERGRFTAINPERLVAVADALETTIDYLLGRQTNADPIAETSVRNGQHAPRRTASAPTRRPETTLNRGHGALRAMKPKRD